MNGCHNCKKWDTDPLTYPYGRCMEKETLYAKEHFNSYYLEGSECAYHEAKEAEHGPAATND